MIHIIENESFLPYHLNQKDLNPESFWKKTIFKSAQFGFGENNKSLQNQKTEF